MATWPWEFKRNHQTISSSLSWAPFTFLDLFFLFMWMFCLDSFPDSASQNIGVISFHSLKLTAPIPTPSSDSHIPQQALVPASWRRRNGIPSTPTVLSTILFGRVPNHTDTISDLFVSVLLQPYKHLHMPAALSICRFQLIQCKNQLNLSIFH